MQISKSNKNTNEDSDTRNLSQDISNCFINLLSINRQRKAIGLSIMDNELTESSESQTGSNNLKEKLEVIFTHYCQFGDKFNISSLKSTNLMKFCQEADLINNILTKTKWELLFAEASKNTKEDKVKIPKPSATGQMKVKINNLGTKTNGSKSIINFQEFLTCMTKAGEHYVRSSLRNDDIDDHMLAANIFNYIDGKIDSIFQKISQQNSQIKQTIKEKKLEIDSKTLSIVSLAFPFIYEFYKLYFKSEQSMSLNGHFIVESSTKSLFEFLKEFELSPGVLSKAICNEILLANINKLTYLQLLKLINSKIGHLLEKDNVLFGKYITLYHFVLILIHIAELGINLSDDSPQLSLTEKLCLMFEKMELSEGFINIHLKSSKSLPKKIISIEKLESLQNNSDRMQSIAGIGATRSIDCNKSSPFRSSIMHIISDNKQQTADRLSIVKGITVKTRESMSSLNKDQTNQFDDRSTKSIVKETMSESLRKNIFTYIDVKCKEEHNNLISLLSGYGKKLKKIFDHYCEFGDNTNPGLLSNFKFTKFLREAGLIRINSYNVTNNYGITITEIDILYIKLASLNLDETLMSATFQVGSEQGFKAISSIKSKSKDFNSRNSNRRFTYGTENSSVFRQSFKNSFHQKNNFITSINSFNTHASPDRRKTSSMKTVNQLSLTHKSLSQTNINFNLARKDSQISNYSTIKNIGKSTCGEFAGQSGGSNSHSMLTYNQFVIGLEVITNMLQYYYKHRLGDDDFFEEFELLFKSKLEPIYENILNNKMKGGTGFIKMHENDLEGELIVNVLKQVDQEFILLSELLPQVFWGIFQYYVDKDSFFQFNSTVLEFTSKSVDSLKMSFPGFFQFANDFEIFPSIISKTKLIRFYKYISKGEDKISIFKFCDLIAQMSFEVIYSNPHPPPVSKVVRFLEKLSFSEGKNRLYNQTGQTRLKNGQYVDFLSTVINYFPEYNFSKLEAEATKKSKKGIGFDDMMQQISKIEHKN